MCRCNETTASSVPLVRSQRSFCVATNLHGVWHLFTVRRLEIRDCPYLRGRNVLKVCYHWLGPSVGYHLISSMTTRGIPSHMYCTCIRMTVHMYLYLHVWFTTKLVLCTSPPGFCGVGWSQGSSQSYIAGRCALLFVVCAWYAPCFWSLNALEHTCT